MERYRKSYDILGIRSGDSWQELRGAYRSAMRQWHPDRFADNEADRRLAEERTKEINRAYQDLQNYYQQHGCLPLDEDAVPAVLSPENKTGRAATADSDTETWVTERTPGPGDAATSGKGRRTGLVWTLVALLLALYFLAASYFSEPDNREFPAAPSSNSESPPQPSNDPVFRVGSSIGEVYSAQGIPTKIEGDVWHYGNSLVFFRNGKVTNWIESADNRLHAQSESTSSTPDALPHFDRGSTKAEVRLAQGKPTHDSYSVWDYGVSHVYFEDDRVIGWYESPLDPLRVRK